MVMRLIDADALINDAMDRYCKDCDKRKGIKSGKWKIIYEIGDVPCRACDVDDMVNDIESAPTVDAVERKRGEWEQVANDDSGIDFRCSVCHRYRFHNGEMLRKYKFCPNCGAEMRGENNG